MDSEILNKYKVVEPLFSVDNIESILKRISNTLAPSQSTRFTRGLVIMEILKEFDRGQLFFEPDYLNSGNSFLSFSELPPKILIIAHLDQISYLIKSRETKKLWRLSPFCKHLSEIEVPAVGLRYSPAVNNFVEIASGILFSKREDEKLVPYFHANQGDLTSGDRVVYKHALEIEGDLARGNTDNAAGVSACLLSGIALFRMFPQLPIGFVFSDEEEGPAENPLYFSRGIRRLLKNIPAPDMCIVVDGYGDDPLGSGALFTEKTGGGLVTVTPPNLFVGIKKVSEQVQSIGIKFLESRGHVSRGDDVGCLGVTSHVLSIGYPSQNRHFDSGIPSVSISDLVNLSKTLFWVGAHFGKNLVK